MSKRQTQVYVILRNSSPFCAFRSREAAILECAKRNSLRDAYAELGEQIYWSMIELPLAKE